MVKSLVILCIPAHIVRTKQTRSSICRIRECLGLSDGCWQCPLQVYLHLFISCRCPPISETARINFVKNLNEFFAKFNLPQYFFGAQVFVQIAGYVSVLRYQLRFDSHDEKMVAVKKIWHFEQQFFAAIHIGKIALGLCIEEKTIFSMPPWPFSRRYTPTSLVAWRHLSHPFLQSFIRIFNIVFFFHIHTIFQTIL